MKAYILVDYTNDFVAPEGELTVGKPAQAIDKAIARGMQDALDKGDLIFVMNDLHFLGDVSHPESALFPPHNICGTKGREIYGETGGFLESNRNLTNKQIFWIDKLRYSSFCGTSLDLLLRQHGIKELEITGVCTDICVLHTAIDAYNYGYKCVVNENRVASFNAEGHAFALAHIKQTLGFVVKNKGE